MIGMNEDMITDQGRTTTVIGVGVIGSSVGEGGVGVGVGPRVL